MYDSNKKKKRSQPRGALGDGSSLLCVWINVMTIIAPIASTVNGDDNDDVTSDKSWGTYSACNI